MAAARVAGLGAARACAALRAMSCRPSPRRPRRGSRSNRPLDRVPRYFVPSWAREPARPDPMVNLPTFRQLEHLVLLAEHGHFGRAAQACHVTQSSLSASIKELENTLQASLVDRTKRRVLLTPLGHEIVERARQILREGEDLVEAARAASEP